MLTGSMDPSRGAAPAFDGKVHASFADDPLAELAGQAAAGDRTAMRELLARVAPAVARTVDALLGRGHPDRDDVAQDALLAVARGLGGFRGESSFLHYARQVALRRAYVARRHRRAAKRAAEVVPFDETERGHGGGECASPFTDLAERRKTELWLKLLDALPEAQSEVLAMKVVLGFSIEEIATATQAPINTVRKRIILAKQAIRDRLEREPALAEELEGTPDERAS